MRKTTTQAATQSHDAAKAEDKRRRLEPAPGSVNAPAVDSVPMESFIESLSIEPQLKRHATLLSDPRFSHSANTKQKAQIMSGLQSGYGNAYVQRLLKSRTVQAKLTVNPPDDQYEREADRIAAAVVGVPGPRIQRQEDKNEKAKASGSLVSGLQGFTPDQATMIGDALKDAIPYVQKAISDLSVAGGAVPEPVLKKSPRLQAVRGAATMLLEGNFHTTNPEHIAEIVSRYKQILAALQGAISLMLETMPSPDTQHLYPANTQTSWPFNWLWPEIRIRFPDFGQISQNSRARVMIHEVSHRYVGTEDYAYLYNPDYWKLKLEKAINNADCYGYFAVPSDDSSPAPNEQQAGQAEEETAVQPNVQREAVQEDDEGELQAKTLALRVPDVSQRLEARINAARVGGQPLPDSIRTSLEPQLGSDFSEVRIHTDAEASRLSGELQAKAFTTGQDVFFRSGDYQPESDEGRRLLAHELTHVVQQAETTVSRQAVNEELKTEPTGEKADETGSDLEASAKEIEENLRTAVDRADIALLLLWSKISQELGAENMASEALNKAADRALLVLRRKSKAFDLSSPKQAMVAALIQASKDVDAIGRDIESAKEVQLKATAGAENRLTSAIKRLRQTSLQTDVDEVFESLAIAQVLSDNDELITRAYAELRWLHQSQLDNAVKEFRKAPMLENVKEVLKWADLTGRFSGDTREAYDEVQTHFKELGGKYKSEQTPIETTQTQQQPAKEKMLQTKAVGGSVPQVSEDMEGRLHAARGSGQPLPDSLRAPLELQLGHDFSGVRIHTDTEANRLSGELQAKAFTTGQDVFFRSGDYQPESDEGRRLLTHELTHVVQQGTISISGSLAETSNPQIQRATQKRPDERKTRRATKEEEELVPKIKKLKDPETAAKDPTLLADTPEGVDYFEREFAKAAVWPEIDTRIEPGTKFGERIFIGSHGEDVLFKVGNTIRRCYKDEWVQNEMVMGKSMRNLIELKAWIPVMKFEMLVITLVVRPDLVVDVAGNLIEDKSLIDEEAFRGYCISSLFAPLGKIKAGAEAGKLAAKATDILVDVVKSACENAFKQLLAEGKLQKGQLTEDVLKSVIASQIGKYITNKLPADSEKLLEEANKKLREITEGMIGKEIETGIGVGIGVGKEALGVQ